MPTWVEITLAIMTLVSTGGFAKTLITLNSMRRKENADAGQSEIALKKAEIEIVKIQDEYARNAINAAYGQLIDVNNALIKYREESRIREQYLSDELAKVATQLIDMTREKLIAEKNYKTSRCDRWSCLKRIPPYEGSKEDEI